MCCKKLWNRKNLVCLIVLTFMVAGASEVLGDTWTTYTSATTGGGIQTNNMRDVEVASDGTVWIATYGGGISKFDGQDWTYYKTAQGLANNTCWDIFIDESAGNVWIATAGGLSKFDGSDFTNYTASNSDLSANTLRAVTVDQDGNVWVGTLGSGLDKFDGSNWTNYATSNSDLPHNRVWDIEIDSSGNLWLATEYGVSYFDGTNFTNYEEELLHDDCFSVDIAPNGDVWVSCLKGINKFDGSNWTGWDENDGMAQDDSKDVRVDSSGIVWVATNGGGVHEFDGSTFTIYNKDNTPMTTNVIWAMFPETPNKIWIGSNSALYLFEIEEEGPPGQASNPSPSDGATDVSTTADLSWTEGSASTSSDVYFGTSSPGTFQGNQVGTTFDPGTMDNDTTYYWRIDEVNAQGTTTGSVWSFTTELAAQPPGAASNPSPSDGATSVDLDANLSWSAGSGATSHDVYFGTDSSPDSSEFQGNQTDTSYDPGTMANDTTYYWRIDEVNAQGTTTGSVWSFTTEALPEPPGDASNPNPAHTQQDVSINADLSWTAGTGATSHDVYFGTDSSPDETEFQGNQTATTFDPGTLEYDTQYYWRIDEVNAGGTNKGDVVWRFNTGMAPPLPGQASNPNPSNGATDVGIDADLSWTAGSDTTSHDVYFGTDSSPDSTEFQGNQTSTTFDPGTMEYTTTYYWRIDEKNAIGATTGVVWVFTTGTEALPAQASNPSPSNGATDVSVDADLSWTAGSGATSHDVYFGTDPSPNSSEFQGNQTGTTFDPGTLDYNTTYYWCIDEVNAGGTTLGNIWDFTTGGVPVPPGQASSPSPGSGATGVARNSDLSWTAGSGAASHDVYFGTTSPGDFQGNQTATTYDPGMMSYDTTYYWRIDEINAAGTTTGSVWNFTTCSEPVGGGYITQSGRVEVDSDTFDVSITPVGDMSRAFMLCSMGTGYKDASTNTHIVYVRGWLQAADNIRFARTTSDYSSWVSYQVIECQSDEFTVYRGSDTMPEDTGSMTINIGGTVNPDNCLAYVTADIDVSSTGYWNEGLLTAQVSSSAEVTIERDDAANASPNFNWIVVEFDPTKIASIENGSVALDNENHSSPKIVTIDSVDTASSILIYQVRTIKSGLTHTTIAGNIKSSTELEFYKHLASAGIVNVEWCVIDFGPDASAQRGEIDNSGNANWLTADATISAVDTSAAMQFHGMTCDGTGTAQPRAVSTAEFTSTTNLQIQRMYKGQESWIEWQVVELPTSVPPGPPGQASNPSPSDGATGVSVNADLSWTAGSGATSRDVYFGTTSPGDFQGTQTGTTFDPGTMGYETTYYWRIDEKNAGGTATGVVWSFTTEVEPIPPSQAGNPSPSDGATSVSITADLSWSAGSGATSHDVYFGTDSSPDSSELQGNQVGTTYDPGTMADNTTYYWRIDEINAYGTTAGSVWSFTTMVSPPSQASNPRPSDDSTAVSITPELRWDAGTDATSHDVYLGTTSSPGPGEFLGNLPMPDDDWDAGPLDYDTTYYWRIDAKNEAGTTVGETWNFTTMPPAPGPASNPSPSDGATDVSINADLSWTAGSDATSHDVYFGTTSPGTLQGTQSSTTFDPGILSWSTTYYWRIDENNAAGTATGSVWSFTTKAPTPPAAASNPIPANASTDGSVNAKLRWTAGVDATSHDVYFGNANPPAFQGNQTATSFDPGALTEQTIYYWRVDEENSAGTTTGELWFFITGDAVFPGGQPGQLVGWGSDGYGQVSDLPAGNDFVDVRCGNGHTIALRADGTVAACGRTTFGAGSPPPSEVEGKIVIDIKCGYGHNLVLFDDGTVFNWGGRDKPGPAWEEMWPVPSELEGVKCVAIAAGGNHDIILKEDGSLACWGYDSQGQVSDMPSGTDYAAVAGGNYHSLAQKDDGTVVHWGYNNYGQGNIPSEAHGATMIDAGSYVSLVLKNGEVLAWGLNNYIPSGSDFIYLAAGGYSKIALRSDSTVVSWQGGDSEPEPDTPTDDGYTSVGGGYSHWAAVDATNGIAWDPDPHNRAAHVSTSVTLSWAAGDGATSHDVYFGTTSPGVFQGTQSGTTFNPGTLANETTYYWRVDENNTAGTSTGTVWNFTTLSTDSPEAAFNPNPANGATDVSVNAQVSWIPGAYTTSHDVYFGTDSTPDTGEFQGNQTGVTFDPGTLQYETTYYWRIDEINANGTTAGTVWSFTTEPTPPPPDQAGNPSPSDGATNVSKNADLSWTAGSGATSHDVYFGTSSPGDFQGTQTATTFDPGTMAYSTTYYWRIDENNAFGTTTGTVWSFTTEPPPPPPGQAGNPSPVNGATDISVYANLSWTAGSGASSHDVYFGTTSPGDFQGNQSGTIFDPGVMAELTTYYWRIDEENESGTTTGDVWSFTTREAAPAGLIGWWMLDEDSGSTAYDESGNGNDGWLGGAASWASTGGCVELSGAGDYVGVPTTGMSASAGTVAIWARLEGSQPDYRFIFGCGAHPDRIQLYMNNGDTMLDLGLGESHAVDSGIATFSLDTWYHIALTWDGSNYVVYVNGSPASSGIYSGLTSIASLADIGNNGNEHDEGFRGRINDVRIWQVVLDSGQVADLHADGVPMRATKAAFSAIPTSGSLPLRVTFTDESLGDNLSDWQWDFGDGGTSTERNPAHIYENEGLYDVTLTVTGDAGPDILTEQDYIDVGPAESAVAEFSASPTGGFIPMEVSFTDLSTGSVTDWDWDFGDGGSSTDQHPTHTYGTPGDFTVSLTVTGPINSDTETKVNYISVMVPGIGGTGLTIIDSPDDLTNVHPHLWVRGYGAENGLLQQAQSTHSEVWNRLSSTARTGSWGGISRDNGRELMRSAMAFVINKNSGFGNHCQNAVLSMNGYSFSNEIEDLVCFTGYCLAYDAIVDDPETTWLTTSQKASALATMSDKVIDLNMDPSADDWRLKSTHNLMALRAGAHAAGVYNLRGESGYEDIFDTARQFCLDYHMERVNGFCDNFTTEAEGPRPLDGFPYEGTNYGAYQGSRSLIHRHILEYNEYPNPATVVDENLNGFSRNYNLAWLSMLLPGADDWVRAGGQHGFHSVLQAIRFYSSLNKAVGDGTMASVGAWFHQQILPIGSIGGEREYGEWAGWEFIFYDASIEPLHPDNAGIPLYVHLDDSEFHMYRDSWDVVNPSSTDTYVCFRNSGHEGHNYWDEGHAGYDVNNLCTVETSTHDGVDNGHFNIFIDGVYIANTEQPQGTTDMHNCLLIDNQGQLADGEHDSSEVPELADTDVIGAVDTDYGHALDAIVGPAYGSPTLTDPFSYHRYFFVIRDPTYVIVVDELESGHTSDFYLYPEADTVKQSDDLYTGTHGRYELMYPDSGYSGSTATEPVVWTTTSPQLMVLCHPNPSGVSKSVIDGEVVATIGQDDIVYNPAGDTYTHGNISGDAKLFAERSGGTLIFQATSATGSEYGISCASAANMSVNDRNAEIYVYGTGTYTVTITSPWGTDEWDIEAGQTVTRKLTGLSIDPPVADFFAMPTYGWHGYYKAEIVSLSTGWIDDYLWEFGDGATSTEVAPTHQYPNPGLYTVKLTVSGPGGSDSMTKESYIEVKDFADYTYPDYIITEATQAQFDAALDAIENSQTPGLAPGDPVWCDDGYWCNLVQHGGGGRILFDASIANSTIYIDWDSRPGQKRDWFGDNLIIDGEDKNISFYYSGSQACSQQEDMSCLRIHGNDNIVRNITWDRFPDGLHMRGGQRNLIEGCTVNVVCEDAMTFNGSGNKCIECIARDNTYQASGDKTFMIGGGGWLACAIINNMHSTNGNQPIRVTGGGMYVVRNSTFVGEANRSPLFGNTSDQGGLIIYENNYAGNGCRYGIRIRDAANILMRYNTFDYVDELGIWTNTNCAGAIRAEYNTIIGAGDYAAVIETDPDTDLGGGLVDVHHESDSWLGSSPGTAPAPSAGNNTFKNSGAGNGADIVNNSTKPVKAEYNFWDHSTVSGVEGTDISGDVDVDPLGIIIE